MTVSGGHDNQILAEPTRGVVEAVSDGYGSLSLEVGGRWKNVAWGDRLAVEFLAQGKEYGSGILGLDGNLVLDASWQKLLTSRSSFQLKGLGWVFRRENMLDFNLNSIMAAGRYSYSPSRKVLLSCGGRYQRVGFTDRFVTPDTTQTGGPGDVIVFPVGTQLETDKQLDVLASAEWRYRWVSSSLEVAHRWAQSNERQVEYTGPYLALRLGGSFPKSDVVGYLSAAARNFEELYMENEALEERKDRAVEIGIYGDRALSPRTRAFLDASWLRQTSEIETFTFDQAQFQLGIKVAVVQPRSDLRSLLDLGPTLSSDGPVVFRYKNREAGRVSVVGDFNGWDPQAHPMAKMTRDVWFVEIPLAPGIWKYSLVVDGEWVTPPDAQSYEPDGFGGRNAVVIVQ